MASPYLAIDHVAQNQNSKEVTINSAIDTLDAATQGALIVSFAAGNVTLTATQFNSAKMFRCQGATAASNLVVPISARSFSVSNEGSFAITVGGATGATVSVPAGTVYSFQNTGTDTVQTGSNTSPAQAGVALGSDGKVPWAQLKPEVQQTPLAFILPGKPAVGALFHLVIAAGTTIPANFAGTVVYAGSIATANTVFTLNRIHGAASGSLGTITFTNAGHFSCTLSTQASVDLSPGDVLQLVAPATQDATLADLGITILALKD